MRRFIAWLIMRSGDVVAMVFAVVLMLMIAMCFVPVVVFEWASTTLEKKP
jgi:hypothetical protein